MPSQIHFGPWKSLSAPADPLWPTLLQSLAAIEALTDASEVNALAKNRRQLPAHTPFNRKKNAEVNKDNKPQPLWQDGKPAHEQIANWLESDHNNDLSGFATYAPHPAGSEAHNNSSRPGKDVSDLPAGYAPAEVQASRDVLVACAREPQNDTGNGQRLLRHFGPELLHVRNVG